MAIHTVFGLNGLFPQGDQPLSFAGVIFFAEQQLFFAYHRHEFIKLFIESIIDFLIDNRISGHAPCSGGCLAQRIQRQYN